MAQAQLYFLSDQYYLDFPDVFKIYCGLEQQLSIPIRHEEMHIPHSLLTHR